MDGEAPTTRRPHWDQPTYWFVVAEVAREQGNHQAAAAALRQLDRLGVHVKYDSPVPEGKR
jgi:hypothetical protein